MDQGEGCLVVIECDPAAGGGSEPGTAIECLLTRPSVQGFAPVCAICLFGPWPSTAVRALLARKFATLNPGESLLIAKSVPGAAEADPLGNGSVWQAVHRAERDLLAFVAAIADEDAADIAPASDASRRMAGVVVRRRGIAEGAYRQERLRASRSAFRAEWLKKIAGRR